MREICSNSPQNAMRTLRKARRLSLKYSGGEAVGNIAKCFLMVVFAFAFLSCDRATQDNRNVELSQDADSIVERTLGMTEEDLAGALHQTTDKPEPSQAVAEEMERIIGMTLIPSVEPELLRNVMPNSWHRLERLTEDEERDFVQANIELFGGNGYNYFSVYRQQVGRDTFFRIIRTTTDTLDFMSRAVSFGQDLIHQNVVLVSAGYKRMTASSFGWITAFESIDIIPSGDGAKAVILTTVSMEADADDPYDWSRNTPRRNGQLFGGNQLRYYLIEDLRVGNLSSFITIRASDALVDPDSPLRHGLQSAFDGDPSTSFVANAENGLLEIIDTSGKIFTVNRLAIINGCARDMSSYRNNNRISRIGVGFNRELQEAELAIDTLSWQVIKNVDEIGFLAKGIFQGERYNDVLISGFNAYIENHGWIFGEIDGN